MIRFGRFLSSCFQREQTACWRHCNSAFYCHHSSAAPLALRDLTISKMNCAQTNSTETTVTTLVKGWNETGTGPALETYSRNLHTLIFFYLHFRFYKHTFQFAGSLAFLPAFCWISALILKRSFWFYRYYIKAEVLTTFLPSSMNIALQVSARHNPQTDKTSLDNAFWFLLELEFKPSQHLLHQCSVLC